MSDSKQITSVLKTWAFEEMGFLSNDNLEQLDTIKSIDLEGYISLDLQPPNTILCHCNVVIKSYNLIILVVNVTFNVQKFV